jgi:hypothetical protein
MGDTTIPEVRQYLVVANQTAESPSLHEVLIERSQRRTGARFFLVVPATRLSNQEQGLLASEHVRSVPGEDPAFALARRRLERALGRLSDAGLAVGGEVGDPDPFRALAHAAANRAVDEIIVSTLASGASRWLSSGLLRRVERAYPVEVTHVQTRLEASREPLFP